jgi:site-specific DNA-methyltransferase (adenine-specific)/modification methylase
MNLRVNQRGDGYVSRTIDKNEFSSKYREFNDNMPMDDYRRFMVDVIRESCRVARIVFINIQSITGNKPALAGAIGECADLLKDVVIWDKGSAQPAMKDRLLNSQFEYIYIFGDRPITRQFSHCGFKRGTESNVWKIRRERNAVGHKAAFPIGLPAKIIELFAPEGALILDPFAGSGTTGIAAQRAGCEFIGCEIDSRMAVMAQDRLDLDGAQQVLL